MFQRMFRDQFRSKSRSRFQRTFHNNFVQICCYVDIVMSMMLTCDDAGYHAEVLSHEFADMVLCCVVTLESFCRADMHMWAHLYILQCFFEKARIFQKRDARQRQRHAKATLVGEVAMLPLPTGQAHRAFFFGVLPVTPLKPLFSSHPSRFQHRATL